MGDHPIEGQIKCLKVCGGCVVVLSIIIFGVCMGSYVHLGPDDQVLLKKSTGKYVQSGPWSGQLNPFHPQEWRKASLLDPLQYAMVEDTQTAIIRNHAGPDLLFLGPYDVMKGVKPKIVLQKDEYARLIDRKTGNERVERGPGSIVPEVTEIVPDGVEKAVFINVGTAVVIRNKNTGTRSLMTSCNQKTGVYMPAPLEEIVEVRSLIHVLPHQAVIVRDVDGRMTVYSGRETQTQADGCSEAADTAVGGTAFFLPPYSKIVRMSWSHYPNPNAEESAPAPPPPPMIAAAPAPTQAPTPAPKTTTPPPTTPRPTPRPTPAPTPRPTPAPTPAPGKRRLEESIYVDQQSASTGSGHKQTITAIDLRTHKSFYQYEVRTSDNVRLGLEGTIFWRIEDVRKMLEMTSDPNGDVWTRCRSTLIAAVSNVSLGVFMNSFNDIALSAFEARKNESFYSDRGLVLVSMELTNYAPVDSHTKSTLQEIIRQTVKRINDLQKQQSANDVAKERLSADISLEVNRTNLLETQARNDKLIAETAGATDGGKTANVIGAFLDGLNSTLENSTVRMELFKHQKYLQSSQIDAEQLSTGNASLYLAPTDMELRLQMPHEASEL